MIIFFRHLRLPYWRKEKSGNCGTILYQTIGVRNGLKFGSAGEEVIAAEKISAWRRKYSTKLKLMPV